MTLHTHWNGMAATPELREHLERRLTFALGRFGDEVRHVIARVADLNGPRGGVDKQVSLQVEGRRLRTLLVRDADANLFTAIDRAADRIGRALGRALERKNHRRSAGARVDRSVTNDATR